MDLTAKVLYEEEEDEYVIKVYGKKPKLNKNSPLTNTKSLNSSKSQEHKEAMDRLIGNIDAPKRARQRDLSKSTNTVNNLSPSQMNNKESQKQRTLKSKRDNDYFERHINNIIMSSKSVNQYYFDTILRKFNITSPHQREQIRQNCICNEDEKTLYSLKTLKLFFKRIISSEDKSKLAITLSPIIKSAIFNANAATSLYILEQDDLRKEQIEESQEVYEPHNVNENAEEEIDIESYGEEEELSEPTHKHSHKHSHKDSHKHSHEHSHNHNYSLTQKQSNIEEKKQKDKKKNYLPDFYDSIVYPKRK